MARAERQQQAIDASLDGVQGRVEGFGRAVVRVRHLGGGAGREVQQQVDLAGEVRPGPALQRAQVGAVHRHDVLKAREIRVLDLTRALVRDAVAAVLGRGDRARIRRLADVERGRAAGIDAKVRREPAPLEPILQHGLGRGRSADIAQAHEEDADALHTGESTRGRQADILVPVGVRRGPDRTWPKQIVIWPRRGLVV